MTRARVVKPELFEYEPFGSCSREARLTFIGLMNLADDDGIVSLSSTFVRARLYPYEEDLCLNQVTSWLDELIKVGLLSPYSCGGSRYAAIAGFKQSTHVCYQRIDKPSKWRNPHPLDEYSSSAPRPLDDENKYETENKTQDKPQLEDERERLETADSKRSQLANLRRAMSALAPPPEATKVHSEPGGGGLEHVITDEPRGEGTAAEDPLVRRLLDVVEKPAVHEAELVIARCRTCLDDKLIDECIGYMSALQERPRLPRYLLKLAHQRGQERGVNVAALKSQL